jgi:hypothetical protein
MNSNIGSEQGSPYTYPNGASATGGTSQAGRASSGQSSAGSSGGQASSQSSGSAQGGGSQMDSLVQTAQRITSQVVKSQYSLPIAIGGAAFILGALASSKILRQLVLVAGAYAVKYAIAHAPKDEMLDFAKNFVKTSLAQPQSA